MVLFNYALKELTAKIVYYGPGLSGKTTNLQFIYDSLPTKNKGRMLSLATETDRTLYFDFLPVDAGVVRGIKTRVQLYTVPGQVFYNATRRVVLKGSDGIVFVADSQRGMDEANLDSFNNLRENLMAHDLQIEEMPLVMQYNKRDLDEVMSVDEMNDQVNLFHSPFFESIAKDGIGVEDTLRAISRLVLKAVVDKYGRQSSTPPLRSVGGAESGDLAIEPVGSNILPTKSDPTLNEPLVSFEVEDTQVTSQESSASTWSNLSEDTATVDPPDNPVEAFKNLHLDDILDEAIKMEELAGGSKDTQSDPVEFAESSQAVDDSSDLCSGLFEEVLPEESDQSLANSMSTLSAPDKVMMAPEVLDTTIEEQEIAEFELDILDERKLDPNKATNVEQRFHDLAQTRLTRSEDMTAANVQAEQRSTSHIHQVELPLTINIDPDAKEIDIQLTLKLRLNREK